MSRLQSYDPVKIEVGSHEVWITPALAFQGVEDWVRNLPSGERPANLLPPLPPEAVMAMLVAGITTWSFTDDAGQREPITLDTVRRLGWPRGKPLADWCNLLIAGAIQDIFDETGEMLDPQG